MCVYSREQESQRERERAEEVEQESGASFEEQ